MHTHHVLLTRCPPLGNLFFFFNDTATPEIYPLSLHDALPISGRAARRALDRAAERRGPEPLRRGGLPAHHDREDRKSTRLNSSHLVTSYAVFCLKKKNNSPPA